MVAITGVLFCSETRAKTLKMSPSLAIEKIMRGIPTAAPSTLQRRHSRHNHSTVNVKASRSTEF